MRWPFLFLLRQGLIACMQIRPAQRNPNVFPACLLLVLVGASYWPGLHGNFLFDDFANLPALGESGPITHWPTFWRFITSGHADPVGRPLAIFSFMLDAHNWPADPFRFKLTNLLLHLCNGALLMSLLRRLGRAISQQLPASIGVDATDKLAWQIDLAAVIGAALWLLHPLFVSTVLYVIQREAMLPATFTLIGLLLWLRGRDAFAQGRAATGIIWTVLGLGGCTLLATLCKANGILLPALALIVEYAVLRQTPPVYSSAHKKALWLLAWLPTVVIASYLLWEGWQGLAYGISSVRPWTLGQRLLTEPRVLLDYLWLLWVPRPFTAGLFNDQFSASTSLWSPVTTVPSILAVVALIFGGWLIRKRSPSVAVAILFYFVGQSLESSTIPLELYFEHRNYLPAMLLFWPLALWLCGIHPFFSSPVTHLSLNKPLPKGLHRLRLPFALIMVLGLATMTYAGAQLWGDTNNQALVWAELNPDSPRAQVNAADMEMKGGRPNLAIQRLQPLLTRYPDQVQIALNLFAAECLQGIVNPTTRTAARTSLKTARDPGVLLISWFSRVIDQTANPPCPQLTPSTVDSLLDAALSNKYLKEIPGRRQDVFYLKGLLALKQQHPDLALSNFNRALDLQVRAALALQQAALLGASGYPQFGLAHLDHYQSQQSREAIPSPGMPRVHAWVLSKQHYWQNELTRLRATLEQDAATRTSRQL